MELLMAEAHTVNKPVATLHLTVHEALYLKGLVQEDLTECGESDEDRKLRIAIWTALDAAGIHTPHDETYRQAAQTLMELIK